MGPLSQQYARAPGTYCKPHRKLLSRARRDIRKAYRLPGRTRFRFLMIGDQEKDGRQLLGKKDARAYLIPNERKRRRVKDRFSEERYQVSIITQAELRGVLERELPGRQKTHLIVLFDLDDTIMPKFTDAQSYAAADVFTHFCEELSWNSKEIDSSRRFRRTFERGMDGQYIEGAEFKFALYLMYLLQGGNPRALSADYLDHTTEPSNKEESLHAKLLTCYHSRRQGPRELAKDLHNEQGFRSVAARLQRTRSIKCLDDIIHFDPRIGVYSWLFCTLEGEHSQDAILDGNMHLYGSVVDDIDWLREQAGVYVALNTNKSLEALSQFYHLPIPVRR